MTEDPEDGAERRQHERTERQEEILAEFESVVDDVDEGDSPADRT